MPVSKGKYLGPVGDKICIFCVILDEHLYLDEWIQYHLKLGIDRIYLVEDFGSRSHREITDKYKDVELFSISDFCCEDEVRNANRQVYMFQIFTDRLIGYKSDISWCFFIDVDEFLNFGGKDIRETMDGYSEVQSVYLFWKIYGANGHIKRDAGTVYELYGEDEVEINDLRESLPGRRKVAVNFNFDKSQRWRTVHSYPFSKTLELKNGQFRTYNIAWVDHFFTKSWEDWKIRLRRGNMFFGIRSAEQFFLWNPSMEKRKEELLLDVDIRKIPLKFSPIKESEVKASCCVFCPSYPERIFNNTQNFNRMSSPGEHSFDLAVFPKINTSELLKAGYTHICYVLSGAILPDNFFETINELASNHHSSTICFVDEDPTTKFDFEDTINKNDGIVLSLKGKKAKGKYLGYIIPLKYIDSIHYYYEYLSNLPNGADDNFLDQMPPLSSNSFARSICQCSGISAYAVWPKPFSVDSSLTKEESILLSPRYKYEYTGYIPYRGEYSRP